MKERTKLVVTNRESVPVKVIDSDNRYGVLDILAEWLRFENVSLDEFTVKIHRYIRD